MRLIDFSAKTTRWLTGVNLPNENASANSAKEHLQR